MPGDPCAQAFKPLPEGGILITYDECREERAVGRSFSTTVQQCLGKSDQMTGEGATTPSSCVIAWFFATQT